MASSTTAILSVRSNFFQWLWPIYVHRPSFVSDKCKSAQRSQCPQETHAQANAACQTSYVSIPEHVMIEHANLPLCHQAYIDRGLITESQENPLTGCAAVLSGETLKPTRIFGRLSRTSAPSTGTPFSRSIVLSVCLVTCADHRHRQGSVYCHGIGNRRFTDPTRRQVYRMNLDHWAMLLLTVAMVPFVMQMGMLAYFNVNPEFLGNKEEALR